MMNNSPLYTRSQAEALTGLDGQTLDYWNRRGILRPVAGGGGKGYHRKYDQLQITLGRLLREAADFGVGGNSLTLMAEKFQASIDWFSANGLTSHALSASSLIGYRNDMDTLGYTEMTIWESGRSGVTTKRIEGRDWDALVNLHSQMMPLPDEISARCKSISYAELNLHFDHFMTVRPQGDGRSTLGEIYLFKNSEGGWVIDHEQKPKMASSFITIRLRQIKRELWRPR